MVNRPGVPIFPVVARRFMDFVDGKSRDSLPMSPALQEELLREEAERAALLGQDSPSTDKPKSPVLLVVHNGQRFDAPFMAAEFNRAGLRLPAEWMFCDSLMVSPAVLCSVFRCCPLLLSVVRPLLSFLCNMRND